MWPSAPDSDDVRIADGGDDAASGSLGHHAGTPVHGESGYGPLEIATAHGICSCGMMALKNAYLQVAIGEKRNAICVASEFASRGFNSTRYDEMRAISEDGSLPMGMRSCGTCFPTARAPRLIEAPSRDIGDQPSHRLADVIQTRKGVCGQRMLEDLG